MKNPNLNKFLQTLNNNRIKPTPKFKKGDVIMNVYKDLKIVSEVIDVNLYSDLDKEAIEFYKAIDNETLGQYTLKDLVNEHKLKPENIKYTRKRDIQKIDAKYDKISEKVAQVLYGRVE